MSLSTSITSRRVPGTRRIVQASVTLDSSYPTSGWAFDAGAVLGLSSIAWVQILPLGGYTFTYNSTTKKILAYVSGGTQVSNATDLSGLGTLTVRAEGVNNR